MLGPTLQTERLILRPPQQDDLDEWAAFMSDPEAMQFLGGTVNRTMAWRGLASAAGSWALLGFGMFSVLERSSGRWIGRVGPWRPEGWPGTEIGWGIARSAWGKGYATEAAEAAMDWAVDELGWSDLVHFIDPGHEASKGVAARLGASFREHGKLPPPFDQIQVEVWGQSREQWLARRSPKR